MRNPVIDIADQKEALVDLNDVWVAWDGKWVLKSIYFK